MTNLPVPSPRTFTVGETETGAFLNSLRDGLTFDLNRPIAQLVQATGQSIPNTALTAVTFDSSIVDSYGGHSNSSNNSRYTAQVPGWYWAWGTVAFPSNATGVRVAQLFKNGTGITNTQLWFPANGTNPSSPVTAELVFLNAGDYLELDGYHTAGTALTTLTGGPQSALTIFWGHV